MSEADRDDDRSDEKSVSTAETGANPVNVVAGHGGEGPTQQPAADFNSYIGAQLRAVYDNVAKQPIPDRFIELMRKLDAT